MKSYLISLKQACLTGSLEKVDEVLGTISQMSHGSSGMLTSRRDVVEVVVKNGVPSLLKLLIDRGYPLHVDNHQALTWASQSGSLSMVEALLDSGLRPTHHQAKAVCTAAAAGQCEIVYRLLPMIRPGRVRDRILVHALKSGSVDFVKNLLDRGLKPTACSAEVLFCAVVWGQSEMVSLLASCLSRKRCEKVWAKVASQSSGFMISQSSSAMPGLDALVPYVSQATLDKWVAVRGWCLLPLTAHRYYSSVIPATQSPSPRARL